MEKVSGMLDYVRRCWEMRDLKADVGGVWKILAGYEVFVKDGMVIKGRERYIQNDGKEVVRDAVLCRVGIYPYPIRPISEFEFFKGVKDGTVRIY